MKDRIFIADLSHTNQTNVAVTFPLGAAFITSYAQKVLGEHCKFKLFKYPESMASAVLSEQPIVLAFSNYQWNAGLTYKFCQWAKGTLNKVVIVFGGPNFPVSADEKIRFFKNHPLIDFYIEFEGEIGFVQLIDKLRLDKFDAGAFKARKDRIVNCCYLDGDDLIQGPFERIADVNAVPSPYLTGVMDKFFSMHLIPMIETTRGCPFSCSFCADGMEIKNRIHRVDGTRTKDELEYIAERVRDSDWLFITDLNFGMYKEDLETARNIREVKERYNWPLSVHASAGKNRPERIASVAGLLKGMWIFGSAIQSTDAEVLRNVKRSNISLDAYRELTAFANNESTSYTEIILGLPGDTKEKHFRSLRYSIESGVRIVCMYEAIALPGTEMASQDARRKFGLITKFRVTPGGVGRYNFGGTEVSAVEIEEIIVGSNSMSFDDYVSCRVMNLFVEAFYNNRMCEDIFSPLAVMGLSAFDFLAFLHKHEEFYSPKMKDILASFSLHTINTFYDSYEEAESSLSGVFLSDRSAEEPRYLRLIEHKAKLYAEIDDVFGVIVKALKAFVFEHGKEHADVSNYFGEAKLVEIGRDLKQRAKEYKSFTFKSTTEAPTDF